MLTLRVRRMLTTGGSEGVYRPSYAGVVDREAEELEREAVGVVGSEGKRGSLSREEVDRVKPGVVGRLVMESGLDA